eukprot:1157229-Pelagomonas_calceolata.AAC.9
MSIAIKLQHADRVGASPLKQQEMHALMHSSVLCCWTHTDAIPNLETLVLTNNRLSNLQCACMHNVPGAVQFALAGLHVASHCIILALEREPVRKAYVLPALLQSTDLEPLGSFSKLTLLSLVGNPVQAKPNYRLYLISICKSLKILDFKKVKQQERIEAKKMFATAEEAVAHGAKTFEPTEDLEAAKAQAGQAAAAAQQQQQQAQPAAPGKPKGPSPEQLLAIKAAIANAAVRACALWCILHGVMGGVWSAFAARLHDAQECRTLFMNPVDRMLRDSAGMHAWSFSLKRLHALQL